jgi:uncharacterized protein YigE (DUF2233 family)
MPKSIRLLATTLLLFLAGCSFNPGNIQTDNGLSFQKLEIGQDKIYLAQIDPSKLQLEIVQNFDQNKAGNLQEIHRQNQSLLTFNGSFFSENFQPTGLLISRGKELSPLVKADLLDAVFTVDQNNQPKLYPYAEFKQVRPSLHLQFAIQNGPTLIDDQGNLAVTNKSIKKANRTAIGITKDGQLVVIIDRETILDSDKSPTLYQFADLIKNSNELKEFGIHSVLNLDGGPSTGLIIDDQYFPELDKIQNAIITKPHSDQ